MARNWFKDKESGFTFLEVAIAVAILGSALVVLIGSVNRNLDLFIKAKNMYVASALADSVLVKVKLEGVPKIREESGTFQEYPGFEWYLNVFPYNLPFLNTQIRVVRVVITWDEGNESFEIVSAISAT